MDKKETPIYIEETAGNASGKKKTKQIFALLGVILIGVIVLATLIVAILPFPGSDKCFLVLLGCDIILPVLIWMYMMIYKWARRADDEVTKDVIAQKAPTKNADAPTQDETTGDVPAQNELAKDAPKKDASDATDKL
ncbi:MAG: hypothetical protein ACI4DU_05455 [Lachnospiraceae bacterium]